MVSGGAARWTSPRRLDMAMRRGAGNAGVVRCDGDVERDAGVNQHHEHPSGAISSVIDETSS